jgi:chromosome segregation ATPase
MAENGTTDIKVQLAGLKQEIENINSIHNRLDTAIDKLTDVSTSVKSMLAVHEQKLDQSENLTEKRLLNEIKSLRNDIGDRVGTLEKYKWIILGGFIAVGWILSKNLMPLLHMLNGS